MNNKTTPRIVIADFHQETNSFNTCVWDEAHFREDTWLRGEAILTSYGTNSGKTLCGILDELTRCGAEVIPAVAMRATSGGPVDQAVVEGFLDALLTTCVENAPVDGLVLGLHGATQSTREEDVCGCVLDRLRRELGQGVVISIACDLHANITQRCLDLADFVCGFQTYPHIDQKRTGIRAARLAMGKLAEGKRLYAARLPLPMIVPASGYSTDHGPIRSIFRQGHGYVHDGTLADFSIFMMQPWLDVSCAASCVLTFSEDPEAARRCAKELADQVFACRKELWPDLTSQEEVVELAKAASPGHPVVLADFADSPGAGALGDNIAPLPLLQNQGYPVRTALVVADPRLVVWAEETGVGSSGPVQLRATNGETVTPTAKVLRLQDGVFYQEGPVAPGQRRNLGRTAVLEIENVHILACEHACGLGDLQAYRAFGMEPADYQLVVVKANASFHASYDAFASHICMTDTLGAASSMLRQLPFRNIPRHFYPFDELDGYMPEAPKLKRS